MLCVAAGLGVWGAILWAPRPAPTPPALAADVAPGQDVSPVSLWFGGGSARLRVNVVGFIASGERGAALLSVNGEPAKAYAVGQSLAQGVSLSAVLPHGVAIDQDGVVEVVTVPAAATVANGFVPAPITASSPP